MPWGTAAEVIERITAAADHAGAATVLVNMNRGAMPHEMFLEQVHRFGSKVLPALQAHTVAGSMSDRRVAADARRMCAGALAGDRAGGGPEPGACRARQVCVRRPPAAAAVTRRRTRSG